MILRCTECSREAVWGALEPCSGCGAILRIEYPLESLHELGRISPGHGINRYRSVLPTESEIPSLAEGWTPVVPASALAPQASQILLKCEGRNPSGSFKDRVAALAVTLACENGARGLVTASSGNSASAMATYCAAAGLPCAVLIETGNPVTKIRQVLAMGAHLIPVEELFDPGPDSVRDLLQTVSEKIGYYLGFAWAPVNPYLTEALKTISFELYHQLEGAPDWVVTPVGGGDLLHGIWKGWEELRMVGLIEHTPRMAGVQSESAPPLVRAFQQDLARVPSLDFANSRISGMNVPFTGDHALRAIRRSNGCALQLSDETVFETQRVLARRYGIWVEAAGAAAASGLAKLFNEGWAKPGERVVCILSGAGFKDPHLAHSEAEAILSGQVTPRDPAAILERLRSAG